MRQKLLVLALVGASHVKTCWHSSMHKPESRLQRQPQLLRRLQALRLRPQTACVQRADQANLKLQALRPPLRLERGRGPAAGPQTRASSRDRAHRSYALGNQASVGGGRKPDIY